VKGRIDHVLINCIDREKAYAFYSWLLPKLGFTRRVPLPDNPNVTGWIGRTTNIWLNVAAGVPSNRFDKERDALRELAFAADTREEVDQIARELEAHGGKILDPAREYQYWPGYYAVFFADPDGIKLEVVVNPQHQG
jgi:glyoxylase I family protein